MKYSCVRLKSTHFIIEKRSNIESYTLALNTMDDTTTITHETDWLLHDEAKEKN